MVLLKKKLKMQYVLDLTKDLGTDYFEDPEGKIDST